METRSEVASDLANEWIEMFSKISWSDHANSIRESAPFFCGETTSIESPQGLLDVSDTRRWLNEPDGDIELIIEVYDDPDSDPIATRKISIKAPER